MYKTKKDAGAKAPASRSKPLDIQIGVGIQFVVLEDVAGLDGFHQSLVVGVDDGGGQTLHHAHSDQSGIKIPPQ